MGVGVLGVSYLLFVQLIDLPVPCAQLCTQTPQTTDGDILRGSISGLNTPELRTPPCMKKVGNRMARNRCALCTCNYIPACTARVYRLSSDWCVCCHYKLFESFEHERSISNH